MSEPNLSPQTHPLAPLQLLDRMIERGTDAEQLGKMMDLVKSWQADRAKESYAAAMAACQAEMPAVEKTLQNKQKGNFYAPWPEVVRHCRPVLNKHGFSFSFSQDAEPCADGRHHMILDIHHAAGHAERKHGFYRLDGKGAKGGDVMSDIQGDVSTHTYAQRDMFRMAFGLELADKDHDGNAPTDFCNHAQIDRLNRALEELRAMGAEFFANGFLDLAKKHCRVPDAEPFSFAEMPASEFAWAMGEIERKRKSLAVCTPLEVQTLKGLIESSGADLTKFLAHFNASSLEKFPKVTFEEAQRKLLMKKGQKEGAK